MHAALQSRLRRRALPAWAPVLAACAAAAVLWFVVSDRFTPAPPRPASLASGDVLAAYALDSDPDGDANDLLPQDYTSIEYIFDL
jgi:hypothetical protein